MAFCHNTQGQSSQCYQVPNQTLQTSTYTTDEQFICYHKRHKGKFLHTTCCSFTLIREIWINFRFAYWFFLSALQLLHCISCNVLLPHSLFAVSHIYVGVPEFQTKFGLHLCENKLENRTEILHVSPTQQVHSDDRALGRNTNSTIQFPCLTRLFLIFVDNSKFVAIKKKTCQKTEVIRHEPSGLCVHVYCRTF